MASINFTPSPGLSTQGSNPVTEEPIAFARYSWINQDGDAAAPFVYTITSSDIAGKISNSGSSITMENGIYILSSALIIKQGSPLTVDYAEINLVMTDFSFLQPINLGFNALGPHDTLAVIDARVTAKTLLVARGSADTPNPNTNGFVQIFEYNPTRIILPS